MDTTSIAAVVSAGMAVVSGVFALLSWRSYRAGVRHEMRHEHDLVAVNHSPIFWTGVGAAWSKVREGRNDLESDIQQLLQRAGPAPGINQAIEPLDYLPQGATPYQAALWDLATRIYPAATRGDRTVLLQETLIPRDTAEKFMDARSVLCGFWDKWSHRVSQKGLARDYKGQAGLVYLLTYLDIAHRQWTGEREKGKGKMYLLAEMMYAQRARR